MSKTKSQAEGIENINLSTALDLLFCGQHVRPGVPPDRWQLWKPPAKSIEADQHITDLIKRSSNPKRQIKMRPRSDLTEVYGERFCPYFEVRYLIADAAAEASKVNRERKAASDHALVLSELKKEASDLATQYEAFIQKWKTAKYLKLNSFSGETADGAAVDQELETALLSMMNLRQAQEPVISSLKRIAGLAETMRTRFSPPGSPADAWSREFVEQLGYGWYKFTGKSPSRGPDFSGFVTSCYMSLGGRDKNFERTIRTVLKNVQSRPQHDRFDRDDHVPADMYVQYVGGRRFLEKIPSRASRQAEFLHYVYLATEQDSFDAMVRIRQILEADGSFRTIVEPYLNVLRNLPGWTEPSHD